jgi:MFS family permease
LNLFLKFDIFKNQIGFSGVLSEIQRDFHIDNGQSGLLQTAFIISYMIFAPFFGYLGDRYNRRIIMSAGVFLWCLTTFIGSYMKVRNLNCYYIHILCIYFIFKN